MSFTVTLPDGQVKEYPTLSRAKEFANRKAKSAGIELEVVSEGTVAHVATPVEGRHFHPWERTETPTFAAPSIEGWRPAYTRKRIGAVVYRSYDAEAELPWRVEDTRSGAHRLAATTAAAREITKAMRHGLVL